MGTMIHVCLETEGSPAAESHEAGERWICSCGANFVYREGFNRGGGLTLEWWLAPALPQPRRRIVRKGLLFGPRTGS